MRKIEMITLFDTDYLVVPNNLLITHSLYSKHQNGATPERRRRDTLSATL